MYLIPNITNDPSQVMDLAMPDGVSTAQIYLRYKSNLKSWYMDLVYQEFSFNNRRVCSHPNLIRQWLKILPFGLACYTLDGSDPYFKDDFQGGRCGLLLLTEAEVNNLEQFMSEQKSEI